MAERAFERRTPDADAGHSCPTSAFCLTTAKEKAEIMSENETIPGSSDQPQSKPYDYKDLSQEAPLTIDPKENDYTHEEEELDPVYSFKFKENDLIVICNALAGQIAGSWQFSPKDTIDDDIRSSYLTLQFLKTLNARLPEDKRMGCIVESMLPFSGGDIYIDAAYRLQTQEMGPVITIAGFDYSTGNVCFRLFDPVKYPNAKSIRDCLVDKVPLSAIQGIEEVSCLTEEEKSAFALGIRNAWESFY